MKLRIVTNMGIAKPVFIIVILTVATFILFYVGYISFAQIFSSLKNNDTNIENSWIFRLILNLFGYGTIFLPVFVLYLYIKRSNFLERSGNNCLISFLNHLYYGADRKGYTDIENKTNKAARTFLQDAVQLIFCTVGLMVSYLIWGLLQERTMTQKYDNGVDPPEKFSDSQYLVFVNRLLAVVIAGSYTLFTQQPRHTVPYYKYIFCAFSNIMSSWFQYEALKYISFPTQVISKTCKIIPVMLMGKVVSKRKYQNYEYLVALLICVGMVMFLMGSPDAVKDDNTVTTFSGAILIIGYMAFDSFTSNWQSELFTQYSTTSMQMMCGVNLFSVLLTTVSLLQQGSFTYAFNFTVKFPTFLFDCVTLSVCSAVGQLFVYYTISCFGPVVFIIIMTVRQGVAIILSCITYQHMVDLIGVAGIVLVFVAIFMRIYFSQRAKKLRKKAQGSATKV